MKRCILSGSVIATFLLASCDSEEIGADTVANEESVASLEKENKDLRDQISQLKEEMSSEKETDESGESDLTKENEALKSQVSELEEELASTKEAEDKYEAVLDENDSLQGEVSELKVELAELEGANEPQELEVTSEEESAETEQKEAGDSEVPREWQSALNSAYTYAELMHMSKAGIYEQLTSEYGENFPEEAAQYAIDNIEYDWENNALESARSYQELMDMSHASIYDQLVSEYGEKFTEEEAAYAIENLD
ncbi:Ltp family lipoprotein [Salinicoccus sesuvii]|uniref:Ltp family lipoprotein n=1 Tax=Salinicoccus sesuvii TaxID=868281 RepID=A0ABV7N3T5_9STAP